MVGLMLLNFVLLHALAYVLVKRFRSTRNAGYLVLGVPLVLWSFVWWQEFPLIHGTSVYTKDGDAWKLAFTLNHLAS